MPDTILTCLINLPMIRSDEPFEYKFAVSIVVTPRSHAVLSKGRAYSQKLKHEAILERIMNGYLFFVHYPWLLKRKHVNQNINTQMLFSYRPFITANTHCAQLKDV